MKKCNKCKTTKTYLEFQKDKRNSDGYYSLCLDCQRTTQRNYVKKIKEGTIKAF
jgi:hypothetical protein